MECVVPGAGGTVECHPRVRSAWAKDPSGAAGSHVEGDGACQRQGVEEVPGAAVEPEGDAWMKEGDLPLAEEGHLRGASVIQGQRQAGCAEEAPQRRTQRTPSHWHRSGPGPNPSSLGEAMPVVSVAAVAAAVDVAVRHEVGDACAVEGAAVERGADVMAKCVRWASGPGFHSGLDATVAHCAVAVPVQNSSCHCVMEHREVAEV